MNTCCKSYKGAMRPPSASRVDSNQQKKIPGIQLEIQHVYGYRVKDMRNNLWITKQGHLTYCAASLGIVHNFETNVQNFFYGMNDDVIAMDVSDDGTQIAIGETGKRPKICVFESIIQPPATEFQLLNTFQGIIQRGVQLLSFNPSGTKLAAIGRNDDHSIVIYDLTDQVTMHGCFMIEQFSGKTTLTAMKWELVTIGPNHCLFWTLGRDELQFLQLVGKQNQYPNKQPFNSLSKILMCLGINHLEGNKYEFVAGAIDGTLQIFQDFEIQDFKKLHQKALQAIKCKHDMILTGGNDGDINILDKKYNIMSVIKKNNFDGSVWKKIRAMDYSAEQKQFFIGTHGAQIFEVKCMSQKFDKSTEYQSRILLSSHYSPNHTTNNEVWGLCLNPANPDIFMTCSDDCTFRVWNSQQRKMIKRISTNVDEFGRPVPKNEQTRDFLEQSKCQSIACNPTGTMIAVGSRTGKLRTYTGTGAFMNEYQIAEEMIGDIKFSPNGQFLAIASNDQSIYLVSTQDFQFVRKLFKHSSSIRSISFSIDGTYLQSTCCARELLYWDLKQFKQDTFGGTKMKDEKWKDWTHCVGWPVQGIYRKGYSGMDINCCDRSYNQLTRYAPHDYHLLACGDDFSQVCVFRYPSVTGKETHCIEMKAHSSQVTNIKFSMRDDQIFTTGGEDQCIIQWRIKKLVSTLPPKTAFISKSQKEQMVFQNLYGGVQFYSESNL